MYFSLNKENSTHLLRRICEESLCNYQNNPETFAVRIDHINTCLDAQLEPETSISAFERFDPSFSNEGSPGIF